MPLILGTNSIKDTGYDVDNSLRFNDGSSDYLNQNSISSGNRTTWTFSCWVKLSKISSGSINIFSTNNESNFSTIYLANNKLTYYDYSGGNVNDLQTNAQFRDLSAFYNFVIRYDSTDGTSSNRIRYYVNGSEITSFASSSYPSSSYNSFMNVSGYNQYVGSQNGTGDFFDGYMSEVVFCDGQSLDATSFGEFDEDSGIWKPIDVSGLTFGTNGFYLDFEDSSALGNDVSGNNNDFTVNNLTAIDQSTDTCTNNFATINPLDTFNSPAISDGNTICPGGSSGDKSVRSTIAISQGKWYWEVNCDISNALYIGIINTEVALAVGYDLSVASTNSVIYNANGGGLTKNGSAVATYSNSSNATIGFALDLDNGTLKLSKDGTFFNSGNAVATSIASDTYSPVFCPNAGGSPATAKVNFGNPAYSISSGNTDGNGYGNFEYAVPSGYYSLNTKNLAEYG